jgi:hypothetical protein
MKTALCMYYDKRREAYADISLPGARAWAAANGIEPIIWSDDEYPDPYMRKIQMIDANLAEFDRVVYVDVDCLFRPGAPAPELLFAWPVNASYDGNGLCTGFMTMQRSVGVQRLLRVWSDLGSGDASRFRQWHDQATLLLLHENWRWVQDLVGLIPTSLVSHCTCPPGLVAYHNGSWGDGLKRMREFRWP